MVLSPRVSAAAGLQVTLAPELDGSLDAVENLIAQGVKVAFGHTNATLDDCEAAMDKGEPEVFYTPKLQKIDADMDPLVVVL